jgi:hypothetical protein
MKKFYGSGNEPEELTCNTAMLQKLTEWTKAFPGQIYLHENVMKQGYAGNFQYGTLSYLEDLKTLHALGVRGICFEAFEMGYGAFADLFDLLARAMKGEEVSYTPCELDKIIREENMPWFCSKPDFPLERYITDPFLLKSQQLYRLRPYDQSLKYFRDYMQFALENADRIDTLAIGYGLGRSYIRSGKGIFKNLSPLAEKMLQSRKLWDFMEDIPDNEDPRAVCRNILEELLQKAEEI